MEQEDSISFSSVVASLLLLRRCVTSTEIVNFLSRLSCEDIEINDIDDSMDDLLCCICENANYSYSLKDNLSYETILYDNITVHSFLESYVDKRVLNLIQRDNVFSELYRRNCPRYDLMEPVIYSNLSSETEKRQKGFGILKKIKKNSKITSGYSFSREVH